MLKQCKYYEIMYFALLPIDTCLIVFTVLSAGGIGTGPGVIPMDPFDSRRGRGFPHQFGGNRRGGVAENYSSPRESKPSYAKSDRERHHDDDDDDGTSNGASVNGGDMRGGRGGFYGNRGGGGGGHPNGRGRDTSFQQPRGGFNNMRGQQQYNRYLFNHLDIVSRPLSAAVTM